MFGFVSSETNTTRMQPTTERTKVQQCNNLEDALEERWNDPSPSIKNDFSIYTYFKIQEENIAVILLLESCLS
jgi:hypothetical protein